MRKLSVKKFIRLFAVAAFVFIGPIGVNAADIVIGAGAGATVYFNVGRAVCRAVKVSTAGTTCEALRIEGRHAAEPLAVLNDVRNGAMEIGIVQSDWVHHAYKGTGPVKFMDDKFLNLRTLFLLHSEPFTVIARRDANIKKLDDLAGKRVNIGRPGSNHRSVMEMVMAAKGWARKSFQVADELSGPEQSLALCHNRIQAMVATVAHPDPGLSKTMSLCNAGIVEIAGPAISKMVAERPYFSVTAVPAGTYKGQAAPVTTFGVRVAAVASEDMSVDEAYGVVKAVFKNLDRFKRLHPALEHLQAKGMMKDGSSLPLHPGAEKYFREMGMM